MFNNARKTLLRSLGIIVFIGIIIFSYFRYSAYIHGPEITSINIDPFLTTNTPSITIHAEIKNTQSVTINGRDITLKEKSHFDEIIVFSPGSNIIEIELIDTFGKQKNYIYRIYYDKQDKADYPKTLPKAKEQQKLEQEQLSLEDTN